MSGLTLYKVANDLLPLLETGLDPETGEMSEELGTALAKFEGKGQAVAAFILNEEATAAAIRTALKQLDAKACAHEKRAERLRDYMRIAMKQTGITQIRSDDGTIDVKLYIEREASVDVFDANQVPKEYWSTPKPPEPKPDKKAIGAAIKEGKDVPGARIVKSDRLTIG